MSKLIKATEDQKWIINNAWTGVDIPREYIQNPIKDIPEAFYDEPQIFLTYMLARPEYFAAFCKYILNIQLLPYQCVILKELWSTKFPIHIASRGAGKSWLNAMYSLLRCLFLPGRKVVICGSSFRQSKIIFEYIEKVWNNAPLLRDMLGGHDGPKKDTDSWRFVLNGGHVNCLPIGPAGEKLRGQRSNDSIIEETKSVPVQIFEEVIAGFSAVSSDPVGNVIEQFARQKAEELGVIMEEDTDPWAQGNQILMSGTAYYQFNHFYDYWMKTHKKIEAAHNPDILRELFPNGPDKDFTPNHYCIVRLPYTLLPDKYMDMANMSRTKSQINNGIFCNEYEAVFSTDSDGFFRRSLIEYCTPKPMDEDGGELTFEPKLIGDKNLKYYMGIDPAMVKDNLCICLIEDHGDHRKVVYCWTTNKKKHRDRLQKNLVKENDYYSYVARKIRDLMDRFNIELILMDSQGGGHAVLEALRNKESLKDGEMLIFETKDKDKPKDTDRMEGIHIVQLIQFASTNWISEANHGLKKDMMERKILFPYVDGATMAIASEQVGTLETPYDNMVDMFEEIEEMKDELSTVQVSHTATGREHFSVPAEVVEGKKVNGKKDRYSALIMANYGCRKAQEEKFVPEASIGGFAGYGKTTVNSMYYGNQEYNKAAMSAYSIYD